jgi:hypothetical protein
MFGVKEVRVSKLGPSPVCPDRVLNCHSLSTQMLGYCPKPWSFPRSPFCTIIAVRSKLSRCSNFIVIFVYILFLQKIGIMSLHKYVLCRHVLILWYAKR